MKVLDEVLIQFKMKLLINLKDNVQNIMHTLSITLHNVVQADFLPVLEL